MREPSKTEQKAVQRLEERRVEAAQRLMVLRRAIETEVGWFPRGTAWVLPLAGFAGGIALAFALRGRR